VKDDDKTVKLSRALEGLLFWSRKWRVELELFRCKKRNQKEALSGEIRFVGRSRIS